MTPTGTASPSSLGADGVVGAAAWSTTGGAAAAYLSGPILGLDANGDGLRDVVIGTSHLGNGGARAWYGDAAGLPGPWDWSTTGTQSTARTGEALAAGDLDGDGYDDLVVGAPNQRVAGASGAGQVDWYRGGPTGLAARSSWTATGAAGDALGSAVAVVPDLDGDGYDELAVAAPYVGGTEYRGAVSVYRGGPTGPGATPAWSIPGATGERLGRTLAAADLDGDGHRELLLGVLTSWVREQTPEGQGGVAVVPGTATGPAGAPAWTMRCETADTCDTALVVDRDGDGADDVLLGGYTLGRDRVLTVVPGGADADGDGAIDAVDCGPTDPDTYLGADERWYDDVDEDCAGGDDWDRDGDGVRAVPRGPDGDDADGFVRLALSVRGSCATTLDVDVWGATPGRRVRLYAGLPGAGSLRADNPECPSVSLDLVDPGLIAARSAGPAGHVPARGLAAPGMCGWAVQALDLTTCRPSPAVVVP